MKVTNELKIYEIDGDSEVGNDQKPIVIESHWRNRGMVWIQAPDGRRYAVLADDLSDAVRNSTNAGR